MDRLTRIFHNPRPWVCRDWLFALAVLVSVFLAYQPAWRGKPVWDDAAHLTRPALRSLEGLRRIWLEPGATQQYYPLVHSAFWVQQKMWGDSTIGYHLVNILLHAFCALLVLKILRRLEVPGAYLAAGIFALHPVMVETVAWISELKNTLSGVFYLGATLAWLEFDETRKKRWYVLALALFVFGLLCKTVIATLPGGLLVILWWKRGKLSWRRDVWPLAPFFLTGLVAGLFTAWVEQKFVGANEGDFTYSLLERSLIAGRAFWFYLGKLGWPAELIFSYPRWKISSAVWWQYLYPAAALLVLGLAWAWRRRNRGPLAGLLFFAGTLFPALGFFNVYPFRYSFVADHFQYLASLGVITLASAGAARLSDRWRFCQPATRNSKPQTRNSKPQTPNSKPLGAALGLMVLAVLAVLTWRQSRMYRDAETLYQTTLARNPGCWLAHNNLGVVLVPAGRVAEAIGHFEEALRLKPDHAGAHNNFGNALVRTGQLPEAIRHYEEALRLKPDFAEVHYNLGRILIQTGRLPEAIRHFEEALRIRPDYVEAHNNLGNALVRAGRLPEAIRHFEEVLRIEPDNSEAHYNLGNALFQAGRLPGAVEHYGEALRLKPGYAEAHYNLGSVLFQMGHVGPALRHFEEALRLKPDYAEAQNNFGLALVQAGQVSKALGAYEKALQLRPDFADAHYNLGNALFQTGRLAEAASHYQEALRLKPDYAEAHYNLGIVLARTGRVAEALEHYEEALRLKPDNAEAHYYLGNSLFQLGRIVEAVEQYGKVLQLKPDFAEAHYNLGNALVQAGRLPEAIGHYEEALRLRPDYAKARANLARLQALQQTGGPKN